MLLFLLWCGIAASMGLLSTLWSLYLFVEFLQLPQQALIDETESLYLIDSTVESFGNFSRLSAVDVVRLVLRPRGLA